MNKRKFGIIGEKMAQKYLKDNKYEIIENNYYTRNGEIDIIASKNNYIIFVEVKTRDEKSISTPLEAVTFSKKKKLIQTALLYLQEHTDVQHLQPRFDVAGMITTGKNKEITEVQYITNAFDGGGLF